jgi:transposase InsO family protein
MERAGVQPHRILSDNGGEFQGELDEWLKEQGIAHTYTQSHSPRQNAICERVNKDIQKLIRVLFVHTNSTRWVPHLPEIEKAKNSMYNSSIKAAPDEVWVADRDPPISRRRRLPQSIDSSAPAFTRAEILLQRAQEAKNAYQSLDNRFKVEIFATPLTSNAYPPLKFIRPIAHPPPLGFTTTGFDTPLLPTAG